LFRSLAQLHRSTQMGMTVNAQRSIHLSSLAVGPGHSAGHSRRKNELKQVRRFLASVGASTASRLKNWLLKVRIFASVRLEGTSLFFDMNPSLLVSMQIRLKLHRRN
jgi:hypothetical protein